MSGQRIRVCGTRTAGPQTTRAARPPPGHLWTKPPPPRPARGHLWTKPPLRRRGRGTCADSPAPAHPRPASTHITSAGSHRRHYPGDGQWVDRDVTHLRNRIHVHMRGSDVAPSGLEHSHRGASPRRPYCSATAALLRPGRRRPRSHRLWWSNAGSCAPNAGCPRPHGSFPAAYRAQRWPTVLRQGTPDAVRDADGDLVERAPSGAGSESAAPSALIRISAASRARWAADMSISAARGSPTRRGRRGAAARTAAGAAGGRQADGGTRTRGGTGEPVPPLGESPTSRSLMRTDSTAVELSCGRTQPSGQSCVPAVWTGGASGRDALGVPVKLNERSLPSPSTSTSTMEPAFSSP